MDDFNISKFSLINGSSALTALLFTSGNKNIGWRKTSYKILLFSTIDIDVVHKKDNGRLQPKGDRSDTCETNRPSDFTTFGEVMNKNGIDKVVGMSALFNASVGIYDLFKSRDGKRIHICTRSKNRKEINVYGYTLLYTLWPLRARVETCTCQNVYQNTRVHECTTFKFNVLVITVTENKSSICFHKNHCH